jgi:Xaa-Pro aminopeptidase
LTPYSVSPGPERRLAIWPEQRSRPTVEPWLPHFYLGHGIGTYPAEAPMIGTDLGEEFDDNFVFPAGMVLVLEPVVWEDGTGGYRSEEIVVITEEGHHFITDYPYAPYGY